MIRLLVVTGLVMLGSLTSGCRAVAHLSSAQTDVKTEAVEGLSHLTGIRYRSSFFDSFMPNSTTVMTVGENIFVNKEYWEERFDPNSVQDQALMIHENEHAKRQFDMGVEIWLWRYIFSKSFRWQEEQAGIEAEWRWLYVTQGYTPPEGVGRAFFINRYSDFLVESYQGMVSKEEAMEWLVELFDSIDRARMNIPTSLEETHDPHIPEASRLLIPSTEHH